MTFMMRWEGVSIDHSPRGEAEAVYRLFVLGHGLSHLKKILLGLYGGREKGRTESPEHAKTLLGQCPARKIEWVPSTIPDVATCDSNVQF